MDALERHRNDADVIPLLVDTLGATDPTISQRVSSALRDLTAGPAIDALCALWAQKRDPRLGQVIAERGYIAQQPAAVRVLSGLRAGAVDALSQLNAESISHLVAALDDADAALRQDAMTVLHNLRRPEAVDALCALWARNRDPRLGQVIAERGYIAQQPLETKILSALKCGKRVAVTREDVVGFFVTLLNDADETVRAGATRSLESLSPGREQDALCNEAIRNPSGPAARICLRTGRRPSDPERACLFLFVTRQLDAYFKEDYEFQSLRQQYDRADAAVQAHVMEVVRSGDRRCAGFFGTRSKPLAECSETEVRLALDSWLRHSEWSRLFQACLELPLKHGLPMLAQLRRSDWEPESPDLKSVYRQILADSGHHEPPAAKKPTATSTLFEKWLAEGARGDLARLDEAELRSRLGAATPAQGVAIVGALAAKKQVGQATVQTVRESPHWLVRLAGHAAGVTPATSLTEDTVADANHWITELASAAGVLECWPGKATPGDLETLAAAPAEAWTGQLGSARKVLRTIMAHRITTGDFTQMVQADEFAAEFVPATQVEFEGGA